MIERGLAGSGVLARHGGLAGGFSKGAVVQKAGTTAIAYDAQGDS